MLNIDVDNSQMRSIVQRFPRQVSRAAEIALDRTAFEVRDAVRAEMKKVFDRPTRYTLNSMRVQRTKNHNMLAVISFKDKAKSREHYLAAQILGGGREQKQFEAAFSSNSALLPSKFLKLNRYGNMTRALVRKALTAVGGKKTKSNTEFVWLGNGNGKLPPGVYQRVKSKGGRRGRRSSSRSTTRSRQVGTKIVAQARGLRPVMIRSRLSTYRKRLRFYEIGQAVVRDRFGDKFLVELVRQMRPRSR